MNKVCSFFMVIGLAAALHVNAQGSGFFQPPHQQFSDENGAWNQSGQLQDFYNGGIIPSTDEVTGGGRMMPPHPGEFTNDGKTMPRPPRPREEEERIIVENQFYINSGTIQFKDIRFTVANGELMRVKRDKRKSKKGYGHLQLSTDSECSYEGNVYIDKKCEGLVTVDKGVTWTGYANRNKRSKQVTVTINGIWNLTDDSYISKLIIGKDAKVNTNGHKLKYDFLENQGSLY